MIAAQQIRFGEAHRNVHVAEGRMRLVTPQKPDRRAILQAHPLFGKLGAGLIDRLAACARARTVGAGATIFQKGDPGDCLFAICAGTVRIGTHSIDGKDAVLNLIHAGEIFGEVALLDGQPRSADAQAVGDCELMVIDRRDFMPMIAREPELALRLIELLCARLRRTSEQVEDITFLDLPARLAKTLLRLAASSRHAISHKITLTQREIGEIVGMSRESINKQLRAWEERGWISLQRGIIVVRDSAALAALADTSPAETRRAKAGFAAQSCQT
jgi:CRP/FNR family transcriptional regulator, cyclic AMP receptor protein